jgi:hypothetical protein
MRTLIAAAAASAAAVGLSIPSPAQAEVITFTFHDRFTETFSDDTVVCQTELYTVTADNQVTTHLTLNTDTGMLRFTENITGHATEAPLDGTGVSYTANFKQFDLETIRSVRGGDVLAEVDTDLGHLVAHGDDGSTVLQLFHAHFTINANGEVTTEFFLNPTDC